MFRMLCEVLTIIRLRVKTKTDSLVLYTASRCSVRAERVCSAHSVLAGGGLSQQSNHTEETAIEAMILAGNEKAEIAKKEGNVNEKGVLLITVIADGAWSKRSYKSGYNALSGVASIIGYKTKKVLYMGVRNKYCSICDKAKLNKNTASAHLCFKNWDGTSMAMEANIIVERFRQSIPMHNIIYNKLIGDGDSSVTKQLFLAKPYGGDVFIKQIECMNHILRNYLNRIVDIATNRKSSSGTVVPGFLQKVLKDKRLKLRCAITKAIVFRKTMTLQHNEKYELLKKDILNSPYHVFGDHSNCANFFCKGSKEGEVNLVPQMDHCGLFKEFLGARNIVAHHAESLIIT
ncbi:hypothetical protein QTP88_027278 [Uroleucon formosanum]